MIEYRYTSPENNFIEFRDDSSTTIIPVDETNRYYRNLIETGVEILPYVVDLQECRDKAVTEISLYIENLRSQVIVTNPGKILVYAYKPQIARQAMQGDVRSIELLRREADARGETVEQLAQLILYNEGAYTQIAFTMDAIEEEAQASIKVADTEAEINYAVEHAKEELLGLMSLLS